MSGHNIGSLSERKQSAVVASQISNIKEEKNEASNTPLLSNP